MDRSHKLASLVLLGPLAAAAACAQGSMDATATDYVEPTKTTEPTQPSGSATVPPEGSSSGGATSGGPSSGEDASATSSGGPDASPGPSVSSTPDAGSCVTVSPSNACGLTPQCGCAANQTCDVTNKTNGAVSCILAGGGALGALCTSSTQCGAGLTCAYGACRPYCETANAACTGTGLGTCGQFYDPPGTAVPNSKVCTITCDLRSPSAACGSNTCIWDSSVKATDCDVAGTKAIYDACTSYNDCKQGLACVKHPVFGFECERWCRVGNNGDCGALEICKDVYGAAAPTQGTAKLGHCQ